jgi:hypothetical protein
MPFGRPGKATEAVIAMAGGGNLAVARENGPRSHHSTQKMDGGERRRSSPSRKKTGGGGSEMTADAVGTDGAPVSAAVWFGEVGRGELRTRDQ